MNTAENILDDDWQNNPNKKKKIRELNDLLRTTFSGGDLVITAGIDGLGLVMKAMIFEAVRNFKDFNSDNDPNNEHDFGSLKVDGVQIFWKIDYYDLNFEFCPEDPSNPAITKRVLTILLPEEY